MSDHTADLRTALYRLTEAVRVSRQPAPISGRNTPENPFGQMTAILDDGTPVDRQKHLTSALVQAEATLALSERYRAHRIAFSEEWGVFDRQSGKSLPSLDEATARRVARLLNHGG